MKKRRIRIANQKKFIGSLTAILVITFVIFILVRAVFSQTTVWDRLKDEMGTSKYTALPPADISAVIPSQSVLTVGDSVQFRVTVSFTLDASPQGVQYKTYTDFPLKYELSNDSFVEMKDNTMIVKEIPEATEELTVTVTGKGVADAKIFTYFLQGTLGYTGE